MDAKQQTSLYPSQENENSESLLKEVFKFSLIALLIAAPIRFYIAQPFIVKGESMSPTFENNQYLIVDQLTYSLDEPVRGEVIIFKYPRDPSQYYIKRIIGLPGETIKSKDSVITITDAAHPEGLQLYEPYMRFQPNRLETFQVTLGDEEYFVLGDNRDASSDSRIWGPLNEDFIVGRALLRLWPIDALGVFPGTYRNITAPNITIEQ